MDCQKLNQDIENNGAVRIDGINQAAPDCICEKYRMSQFSPNTVDNSENLARFIFSPIHVDRKGRIKPSIFSQIFTTGCSIQRDGIATSNELIDFTQKFLSGDDNRLWKGVLIAKSETVRKIVNSLKNQAICVYDTAEMDNPAHAEMMISYNIAETDRAELTARLYEVFDNQNPISPEKYRNGEIWQELPSDLKRS